MSEVLCRLCCQFPAIQNSHVISRLVFRAIKEDSPTGYFRNPHNNPDRRIQDGDKLPLLCTRCEQRFGTSEGEFARNVFSSFHANDRAEFSYGPWLHYFMTSLAWRTLTLDLPGLESDAANPRDALAELAAAETMRQYLLGASNLARCLQNHAVVCTKVDSASPNLAAVGPNVMIRRSVFGYTIVDQQYGYSAVLHNLAGFMCFLIVKGNPRDTWYATTIDPSGGEMKQPQHVNSWLVSHLLSYIMESAKKHAAMSDVQRQKVRDAMRKKPSAPGLRFHELDNRIVVSD